MIDDKLCKYCKLIKPYNKMCRYVRNNKLHVFAVCYACKYKNDRNTPEKREKMRILDRANHKRDRKNKPHLAIIKDSRNRDKKCGMENDLTKEFVLNAIKNGCIYCGEKDIRMTLDRIDNNLGHLQSNVVPACIRCNTTRRDMPYDAWLIVAEGMKKAKTLGLFDKWAIKKTGKK